MKCERWSVWTMAWAICGLWMVAGVGCDGDTEMVEHPEPQIAWESLGDMEGEVVARVDGAAITEEEVLRLWKTQPEWTAQEAVDAAVTRRLVADEGHRRGISERPEVAFARKQGLVAGLLREEVEAQAQADPGRRQELAREIASQRRVPAGYRASHLVIVVDDEADEALGEKARALLDEVRREELDDRATDDDLRAMADRLGERLETSELEVSVDVHLRFPRPGQEFTSVGFPEGWITVVPAFAEGAEAVVQREGLGVLSEPVETPFGWHVIRVDERMEAREADPAQVERLAALRAKEEAQRARLREMMAPLGEAADFVIYPDRLQRDVGQ